VGAPLPVLIGALVVLGFAGYLLTRSLGSDDAASPTPTPPSPSAIDDPADQVCRDLVNVQVLRVGALGEAEDELTADADALRAAGDPERADLVDDVVAAIGSYIEVAEGGGDAQAATNQLLDALGAIGWCT
jgi:hypothetical protein